MNSHEVFIHIHQGCFAGTGAIVRLPQCQWSKPDGYGKISQCITTTKHSKAKTACIFLGIYCNPQEEESCTFSPTYIFYGTASFPLYDTVFTTIKFIPKLTQSSLERSVEYSINWCKLHATKNCCYCNVCVKGSFIDLVPLWISLIAINAEWQNGCEKRVPKAKLMLEMTV